MTVSALPFPLRLLANKIMRLGQRIRRSEISIETLLVIQGPKPGTVWVINRTDTRFESKNISADTNNLVEWARLISLGELHDAARAARRWLEFTPTGSVARLVEDKEARHCYIEINEPPIHDPAAADRLSICLAVAKAFHLTGVKYIETASLSLAAVQVFYQCGKMAEALAFLDGLLAFGRSAFLDMIRFAVNLRYHGGILPPPLNQLLGADLDYFADKWCDKPFTDFEVTPNGNVYICCPNHLPMPIGNAKREQSASILNSAMAVRIRRSIIDGKFTYCDWAKCPVIKNNALPKKADLTDPAMLQNIRRGNGVINYPVHVRLSYDSTCNLWCPSCRTKKIAVKGKEFDEVMAITENVIMPVLHGAHTVMMNGYGDIFSSRACRRLLEVLNQQEFPHLKLKFLTNGVLLTEEEWSKFPNIHGMVHSIRVSIDAARKETYDRVRLGGDFDKLARNLEFMSRLRHQGVIDEFMISMVVQQENFREMEEFFDLGCRLDCDYVIFEVLQNWSTYTSPEYEKRAVHLRQNPSHPEFVVIATRIANLNAENMRLSRRTKISHDFGLMA